MTFEEWGERFYASGAMPGEPMRDAETFHLDGRPRRLSELWRERPAALLTASLTCPVARSRIPDVMARVEALRGPLAFGVLYTREAHPRLDPAPHAPDGGEWLTPANEREGILHRQPRRLEERLALARVFSEGFAPGCEVFVDGMEDTVYRHLGTAPCMALLVDRGGIVLEKQGWLEPEDFAALARSRADVA